MDWKRTPYPIKVSFEKYMELIEPGDLLAFGGAGKFSQLIKVVTRACVSHIGIIRDGDRYIESAACGVISMPHDALQEYKGEVWLLKLSYSVRKRLRILALQSSLDDFIGKKYDLDQAMKSPFGVNREDTRAFFCSELASVAYERSGVLNDVNSSEVTPIDLCRFAIYGRYFQVNGQPKRIRGFNTLAYEGFGY